jgi:hypothetical protein
MTVNHTLPGPRPRSGRRRQALRLATTGLGGFVLLRVLKNAHLPALVVIAGAYLIDASARHLAAAAAGAWHSRRVAPAAVAVLAAGSAAAVSLAGWHAGPPPGPSWMVPASVAAAALAVAAGVFLLCAPGDRP